jgi:1-acyl-sn-glycerol-3-phosphate acyltransferase
VVPAAGPIRTTGRLFTVLIVVVAAVIVAPLLLLRRRSGPAPSRLGRLVSRSLLCALGVRHQVHGQLPRRAALVVANHVSWLDILVLRAHLPVRLVAKREVRDWPVVGLLAAAAGTLFIDRSRPRVLPETVKRVEAALRNGSVVALFPEGTTWCGNEGGRFRPAIFQAAINAGATVAPVTLRFSLAGGAATTVAAFISEDTIVSSLLRIASARRIHVSLRMHPPLYPVPGAGRRVLARATQLSITGICSAERAPGGGRRVC